MKPAAGPAVSRPPSLAALVCTDGAAPAPSLGSLRGAGLGGGSFRNPVLAGDHPEPALLQDGADYYLSCASFQSCPGVVIWHSRDLVHWVPIGAALARVIGSVQAVNLIQHAGRYFIYLGVRTPQGTAIHVVHADDMRGPWSAPIDLGLPGCAAPAHVVDEAGQRHLFVNGLQRVRLSDDGLATAGGLSGTDCPALESARMLRHGEFVYLITTASGSAVHRATVARAPSLHGPWEACPFDPVTGSAGAADPWQTGGPLNLVQGPAGDWWMVCHGHEKGFRTLGRQTLLQPVGWTREGWFRVTGSALDRPQRTPRGGTAGAEAMAAAGLSDDFTRDRLGTQWSFFDAAPDELRRAHYDGAGLLLRGKGTGLADCSPLTCTVGDHSYEAELDFELIGAVQGGLALFHDARGFVGVGIGDGLMHTYNYGQEHNWTQQPVLGVRHRLRVTHHQQRITFEHAAGDGPWVQNPWLNEVSALHQNVFGGFPSLRPALFAAGAGEVRLRRFSYRATVGLAALAGTT
ncbi:xylan 1,4-beta-xylosidase [Pelomonas aquatica]|uniref:Xylan 1,4-beta-xylosidase n=1 Tax=Pelomonas aquatica TaxID=431058 RepID=A0ABU1ZF81_9BURK|nr:family 43 glycosylhydrolase [Pelomonas aquatica]MDR7299292.1 xylan 1,4-beta-xylosidase [Pelomonas aquatica]